MAIIEIELAIQHVKADDEAIEDPLFALYLDSAQSICEGYCNRNFYEDANTRYAAFDDGLVALAVARDEWDAAVATEPTWDLLDAYASRYNEKRGDALKMVNGCVADGAIKAAILMTFGHLYRNRQDVVIGNVSASQVPVGAQRILQPYLHIGDLAGNDGGS
jgi:hypothetical protein